MRVFLSSTYEDLVNYRSKAADALERLGQQGIRMEVFGARAQGATEVSLQEVEASDAFIGIYAHRYGFIPRGSVLSITEQEFDYAYPRKPVFCFVIDEDFPWLPRHIEASPSREKLANFKKRLSETVILDKFTTAEDLAFKISSTLGRHLIATRVSETLEKAPSDAGTAERRTQVARRAARLANLIKGVRLLVVNDVPSDMSYVTQLLTELGVVVVAATSTPQALDRLKSGVIDVVVSDMARDGIPDDGIRLLKRMRETGLHRPTIFTVGNFDPSRGTPPFAFGITNRVDDLLNFIFDIVERIRD